MKTIFNILDKRPYALIWWSSLTLMVVIVLDKWYEEWKYRKFQNSAILVRALDNIQYNPNSNFKFVIENFQFQIFCLPAIR